MNHNETSACLADSHAHIHAKDFDKDREDVIEKAGECGIKLIIEVGSGRDITDMTAALELSEKYPSIYASIGVHPHDSKEINDDLLAKVKTLAAHHRVVGIGETGLDYHYRHSSKEVQKEAFRTFISVAKDTGLPLILHIREAYTDALKMLEEYAGDIGGVAHCFSGDYKEALRLLEMGFYISFSGVITFSNADELRKAAGRVPVEKMLIETDSPYLSPHPLRGRRNEPANVYYTAKTMAEIKGLSLQDIGRITTLNTKKVFGIEEEKKSRIAYPIRESLYLNITNRCTNHCRFCPKFKEYVVKGHFLRLDREPSLDEILSSINDYPSYKEVVFCGFGEPLLRPDTVVHVAKRLKKRGVRVRIDTDGLANLVYGRNVVKGLQGIVDAISVSLNAPDEDTYSKNCISKYGKKAYAAVKDFISEAKKYIPDVTATVVALPEIDIEACRRVAEDELKVKFRVREYNNIG